VSRFRVYIKPFNTNGDYATSFTEVTDDVDFGAMGSIKESIDSNEYDVGVFKFNQFPLRLNNLEGLYSDIGTPRTIFAYKRSGSLVKVTWTVTDDITQCGNATCGDCFTSIEVDVFLGLLNDESLKMNIRDQFVAFQILGLESIFESVETPYASITTPSDDISDIIYTCLNQTKITDLMTVSASNISISNDIVIDNKDDLENTTVKEALDLLLLAGNSVLYIKDQIVYVHPYTATVDVKKRFYGQGSDNGIEDIQSINSIKSGLNKTFNFWTWDDTSLFKEDTTSVSKYGIRKKGIDISLITDTTKRNTTLTTLKNEYRLPRQEFFMTIPITYKSLELFILDRIEVDYPIVYRAAEGSLIPLYSVAVYGADRYPNGDWAFGITVDEDQVILERRIDTKRQIIIFKLRKI
jgi:hypothetical protein